MVYDHYGFTQRMKATIYTGGLIAYPTEAVWGLGCDPHNQESLLRLLALKKRPWHKGLILVTGSLQHAEHYLNALSQPAAHYCRQQWPGHVTFLLPDQQNTFGALIKGAHDCIAIRVSQHPFIQWYSEHIAPFLVSTSANVSKKSPVRHKWQAYKHFGSNMDIIVPGKTLGKSRPSRLIDPATQIQLR